MRVTFAFRNIESKEHGKRLTNSRGLTRLLCNRIVANLRAREPALWNQDQHASYVVRHSEVTCNLLPGHRRMGDVNRE